MSIHKRHLLAQSGVFQASLKPPARPHRTPDRRSFEHEVPVFKLDGSTVRAILEIARYYCGFKIAQALP
jgi:hypothetical protein